MSSLAQRRQVRHGAQAVVAEVERAQARESAEPVRDLREPELTDVQALQLEVGLPREPPQSSYSPSSVRMRRTIASDDAYVESMP